MYYLGCVCGGGENGCQCASRSNGLGQFEDFEEGPSGIETFVSSLPQATAGEDLGSYAYNLIEQLSGAIPVAGPFIQGAMQLAENLQQQLHIGIGRNEADVIVHDRDSGQNLLMAKLGSVTDAFRTGTRPNVEQLREMWLAVYAMGDIFKRFVLSDQFRDRRASGQALNTVFPYIDGTCGYAVPLGASAEPSSFDCIQWGDGTLGGPGTDGMLGALARIIRARGGAIPTPSITQGYGRNIPTLEQIWPGASIIPQAGILGPASKPIVQHAGIIPIGGGSSWLPIAAALVGVGALAFSFSRR